MHNTELSLVCRVLGQSFTQFDAITPSLISSNNTACPLKQLLASLPGIECSTSPAAGGAHWNHHPNPHPNSSGVPTTPEAHRWRAYSHFCSNTGSLCGISD